MKNLRQIKEWYVANYNISDDYTNAHFVNQILIVDFLNAKEPSVNTGAISVMKIVLNSSLNYIIQRESGNYSQFIKGLKSSKQHEINFKIFEKNKDHFDLPSLFYMCNRMAMLRDLFQAIIQTKQFNSASFKMVKEAVVYADSRMSINQITNKFGFNLFEPSISVLSFSDMMDKLWFFIRDSGVPRSTQKNNFLDSLIQKKNIRIIFQAFIPRNIKPAKSLKEHVISNGILNSGYVKNFPELIKKIESIQNKYAKNNWLQEPYTQPLKYRIAYYSTDNGDTTQYPDKNRTNKLQLTVDIDISKTGRLIQDDLTFVHKKETNHNGSVQKAHSDISKLVVIDFPLSNPPISAIAEINESSIERRPEENDIALNISNYYSEIDESGELSIPRRNTGRDNVSEVVLSCMGSYPFLPSLVVPSIDFSLNIKLVTDRGRKYAYLKITHNYFPAYELFINEKKIHTYIPNLDTFPSSVINDGPGLFNLSASKETPVKRIPID